MSPDPPDVQAVQTIGGVITDLVKISETLPVPVAKTETVALQLEQLSSELAQAAMLLRTSESKGVIIRPCPPGGISS